MSLILDALKRAERERRAERSAALEDLPGSAAARPRLRWGRWLALGALAIVVVAVAVGVTRRPRPATQVASRPAAPAPEPATRTEPPATQAPQAQAPPAVSTAPPAQAPIQAQPAPAQPPIQMRPQAAASRPPAVVPGTEGVASLDDITPESDVELEPAAPPAAAGPTPPPELTAEPAPAPAEPEEEPAEAETQRPQTSTPAQPAPRPVPPSLTQRAPPRKLREMPPDYRADFPALTVEVHVFEPGRRFVMINGRRYREGERLHEGPQIVEIVRDGIVMDYRGERILYTLGR